MINSSNMIRFGGIASGMDTENMLKQLMKAERQKMDRFTQRKIYRGWQQDAYKEINKVMATYILDARKKMNLETDFFGNVKPGSASKMNWVKSAESSNKEAFSVSASASAMTGDFQLKIERLATASSASSTAATTFTSESKLSDVLGVSDSHILDMSINGKDFAADLGVQTTDTLSQVAAKIREHTGLSASFDAKYGLFHINAKNTGTEELIRIEGADASVFKTNLNLAVQDGQKSKFEFNGVSIEDDSNNISIHGLQLALKKTTAEVQSIRVSVDVDGAFKKIKEFVDDYNSIIDTFSKKINEQKHKDFLPLTNEQKEAMKENDIKLWEQKAKSGLLQRDQTVNSMLQRMRAGMYEKVSGAGSLYEMGITTGNYKDGGKLRIDEDKIKKVLQTEPEKLINTLFGSSKIEKAEFTDQDTEAERQAKILQNKQRNKENGVFVRVFDHMIEGIENIVIKSGPGDDGPLLRGVKGTILQKYTTTHSSKSEIDLDLIQIGKRIDAENRRISAMESRYWKQFTEMEKAMQQMQSQSGWIAQQLGGLK